VAIVKKLLRYAYDIPVQQGPDKIIRNAGAGLFGSVDTYQEVDLLNHGNEGA